MGIRCCSHYSKFLNEGKKKRNSKRWYSQRVPSFFNYLNFKNMKPRLKYSALVVLIGVAFFLSCSKPDLPPPNRFPPPPPPPPSLAGQEFQFDSLTWFFYDGSFDVGVNDIYLKTPPRADLFPMVMYQANLNAEVLIKFDTASNWVQVKSINLYSTVIPVQYMYWIHLGSLYIDMLPLNYQLIGRKATMKVKFL